MFRLFIAATVAASASTGPPVKKSGVTTTNTILLIGWVVKRAELYLRYQVSGILTIIVTVSKMVQNRPELFFVIFL